MQYELSAKEIRHIERYHDLLPELQETLNKQLEALFDLQACVVKEMLRAE